VSGFSRPDVEKSMNAFDDSSAARQTTRFHGVAASRRASSATAASVTMMLRMIDG